MLNYIYYQKKKYYVTYCGVSGDGDLQLFIQDDFGLIDESESTYRIIEKKFIELYLDGEMVLEKLDEY